jgi:Domain of unknown function (DUF4470)
MRCGPTLTFFVLTYDSKMSKLLWWPSKYYFYPIGNTSAVSLTGDLPPEEPAKLLLLGCGDPRNVLFTIYTEPPIGEFARQFQFEVPLMP